MWMSPETYHLIDSIVNMVAISAAMLGLVGFILFGVIELK